MTQKGMILSGIYKDKDLVEVMEIADHPWFLGCQYHPEFKSKPLIPHPLFSAFVRAALVQRDRCKTD
jgi:CTP synthase